MPKEMWITGGLVLEVLEGNKIPSGLEAIHILAINLAVFWQFPKKFNEAELKGNRPFCVCGRNLKTGWHLG